MPAVLRSILTLAVLLTGLVASSASEAGMLLGTATSQPVGHYDFCKRNRAECGANAAVGPVAMTDRLWAMIIEINAAVNAGITPKTDDEIYGVPEYWAYPTTVGDCEDFALLKQFMLEREGLPRSALLLTVVRQPNGDGHAVLTVSTDRGDIILDNLDRRALDWSQTPYRYLKRQSQQDSAKWVSIDDDRDMLVGSVR
ncbi:transglutaminase-like cysteine peptidase [Aureimonas pseudogalii]|uniref:Putative transglutaminase-like cysteine proteinase n=1 Tax=Aureimonas pseudogalii TaxID=1744844 RepID=A0A7W6EBN4_9HYPH|nr:transglutaminase-like cysteine peptidase [Aureimonas pseudogalii]MBB3998317.1 putative transglutaminase-like cysteine proteinase [Aureimonas pseudogalii]